ncbi:suppressor of fused domain protein [Saccharopolyspora sp. SCSIO 74807]|uniref:suppressor of fused domain protein n=1 Tax=Saccharopolyspora sp. SCSIO 74807 TaxID=3118084 RepID=UPI0030D36A93
MSSSAPKASSASRHLAQTAAQVFGGTASVHRFYDEDESHSVGILSCNDAPQKGFRTYSTIGVHEATNMLDNADVRVELAGVSPTSADGFANMLATAAFQVSKEGWLAAPGVVFPNLVREYGLSDALKHILWVEPFPWENLGSVEASRELTVHWLLGIPIADTEREYLQRDGYFALESLFEQHDLAYYDLDRAAVV